MTVSHDRLFNFGGSGNGRSEQTIRLYSRAADICTATGDSIREFLLAPCCM